MKVQGEMNLLGFLEVQSKGDLAELAKFTDDGEHLE